MPWINFMIWRVMKGEEKTSGMGMKGEEGGKTGRKDRGRG